MKPLNEKQSEFLYLVTGNEEQGPFFPSEYSAFALAHKFVKDLSAFDTEWYGKSDLNKNISVPFFVKMHF